MKNEKLLWQVLRMFHERAEFWRKLNIEKAIAYQSAHNMLLYALDGNEECLRQFDTYGEDKSK